jgi:hypothetical protein
MKTNKNKILLAGVLSFCFFSIQLSNSQTSGTTNDTFTVNSDDNGSFGEVKLLSGGNYTDWHLRSIFGDLLFSSNTNPGYDVRMKISSNGNVGIGENTPQQKLHVNGTIQATKLKLTGSFTFFDAEVPTGSFNAIRGSNGSQEVARLHFFDDTWNTGNLNRSSGSINIDGIKGVTLGEWYDPILIVDKDAKTLYGNKLLIGSTVPSDMVSNTVLTVDGRTYISENGGTEKGFSNVNNDNYKDYLLWVEEGIVSADFAIVETSDWPDYVFKESYKLSSLEEIEQHILEEGHLPNFPSAEEVETMGYSLDDMTKRLLKTVEEMTLHTIQQEKKIDTQNSMMQQLVNRLEALENK